MDNFFNLQLIAGIALLVFVIIVIFFRKQPKQINIRVVENSVKIDEVKMYHIKNIMRMVSEENHVKYDGYRKLDLKEDNEEKHLLIELINHGVDKSSPEIFPRILHITSKGRFYWETDLGNKPMVSDGIEEYLREEQLMI